MSATTKAAFEVVLPVTGRFARMRPITWGDVLLAVAGNDRPIVAVLASRICTLDDKTYTPQQWMEFEFEDIAPVANEINRRFEAISKSKGVA